MMSQSASSLLLRNLHDVFGEIDSVRRRTAIDEIFHEDAVFYEPNGTYRGRDEIDRIAGAIKPRILTSNISRSRRLRRSAMAVGFGGCRALRASRRLTPERISSSFGTAKLPPSICSSTSCQTERRGGLSQVVARQQSSNVCGARRFRGRIAGDDSAA